MKKNTVIVFDFDGVLVDTVGLLYNIYIDFLREQGHLGSREEFNFLNGPKLTEIIAYLKGKYGLAASENDLLAIYHKKLSGMYTHASLHKGAESTLAYLSKRQFRIALASSSKREGIEQVLDKFNLTKYFDFIITGDEVKTAKPSPEIYLRVRKEFPSLEYLVVEDSANGVKAAKDAEMKVIFFNPPGNEINKDAAFTIRHLSEIERISLEASLNCFTVYRGNEFRLQVTDFELEMSPSVMEAVEKIWTADEREKGLVNGSVVCCKSYHSAGSVMMIECFISQYKYFYAKLKNPSLELDLAMVGVSGVIIDKSGRTLVAARHNVSEYSGYLEFMPSGGIDSARRRNDFFDFAEQIEAEFEEETGGLRRDIESVEPFCLIFDKTHNVYDICCKIHLDQTLESLIDVKKIKEYQDAGIVSFEEVRREMEKAERNWVPVSRILFENLEVTPGQ